MNTKKTINFDSSMKHEVKQSNNDVLCGRGKAFNKHPGNVFFHDLVLRKKDNYSKCNQQEKTKIALSLVEHVRNQNPSGRFLKQDSKTGVWSEIGDKKIIEKVRQALRDAISHQVKKNDANKKEFIPYIPLEVEQQLSNENIIDHIGAAFQVKGIFNEMKEPYKNHSAPNNNATTLCVVNPISEKTLQLKESKRKKRKISSSTKMLESSKIDRSNPVIGPYKDN